MTDELADLNTHHIEGMTKHGEHHFRIPLYTPVAERLVMGGCPVETAPSFAWSIVNLYPWAEYALHPGQVLTQYPLLDNEEMASPEVLHMLADAVNVGRQYGTVLVHCQAGLNRSGLITALALFKSSHQGNMEGAIRLLREKRSPAVLCNENFEKWLLDQDKRIIVA